MRATRTIMGMPVIVEVVDRSATDQDLGDVFNLLFAIDNRFSPYKQTSELTKLNDGSLPEEEISETMRHIFELAEITRNETNGYFAIGSIGSCDPSGIVKGWAIQQAADALQHKGFNNYYVEIAGDIQVAGVNEIGHNWQIGIRNPFNKSEVVKVLSLSNCGIATSGSYERGPHIYNPKTGQVADEIASITVIAPTIYDADRFATAAFAMGETGIMFLEKQPGVEGYMINKKGIATMTTNFERFVTNA